ncbi:rhodanese-like domain-containing protein [Vulgatibacter incomptus]|uniref:Rhodanese-like domain protein n=1 Tax=Vulgatibacter incomptus TaxID=1391653 RepID=A0A0K1PJJ9_9BACT|nr:rhodanese-like domain-containing protein [Vulgatibacter incomptus]AKU93274.1 Rhodanese-like domain protein [Vulgatibacter incomptus]
MVAEISVEELESRLREGLPTHLVDVRQPWENELAALPGSQLLPLGELVGRADEVEAPAGALVVVYCHHGVRSLTGVAILQRAGLADVVSLEGGIDAWSLRIDADVPRY